MSAYSRLKEADFQAAAAEASYRGAQQSLVLRVAAGLFRNPGRLGSARGQRRRARGLRRRCCKQAQVREQTGVGPRSDAQQAQAFYDATEETVIDARNALDDANLALTEIVGTHGESIAPLRENIPLASPEPASVDDWVALGETGQSRRACRRAQSRGRGTRYRRAARPRAADAVVDRSEFAPERRSEALGGNQTLDSVGVAFNWPLFQGGAVASAVRQSRALYRQAQAQFDGAQRDAERQTRAAYRGVVSGIERIAAAQRAVESGSNAVEASRRNVEFGTGTEFDLLNAQNNYYAARARLQRRRATTT
jgi:outer membrane protein